MSDKVIFLDRDGVINVDLIGDYIKSWDEFRFEEDAINALKLLKEKGYALIIISNQAGVGDGVFTKEDLEFVHQKMIDALLAENISITDTFYCLHGKKEGCDCRKPEIGLFLKAAEKYSFVPEEAFFIGDKATDMEAGNRMNLQTIFVRTGHGKNDEAKLEGLSEPDFRANHFLEAVEKYIP